MEYSTDICSYLKSFSSIAVESFYVLDVVQQRICYIKSDELFLCAFTEEEALDMGEGGFRKILAPSDFSLWKIIQESITKYLKEQKSEQDKIDYFSCTFRLNRTFSFVNRALFQMVYQKMKPIWENGELRYWICSVESSTLSSSGNLCLHYQDGITYSEYNFVTRRWKKKEKVILTERERAILMLARQGKSAVEISNLLCRGHNTVRNQIKALFFKLKTHSIQETIERVLHFKAYCPQQIKNKK